MLYKHSGRIEDRTHCEDVTELTLTRMRNRLSGNKRKPLNGPDLSEKGKKRHVKKPRNAHAGRQKKLRSGRQKSVPNKRQRQLLRPRFLQRPGVQALSAVVLGE